MPTHLHRWKWTECGHHAAASLELLDPADKCWCGKSTPSITCRECGKTSQKKP